MAFDDRLQYLLLGIVIGFVLGYLVRLVKDIKEELDEVDTIVKRIEHHDDESGFMRYPWIANIAILLVVGLTAYASFVSQKASNEVADAQEQQEQVVACNQMVLAQALEALNERSTYTTGMATSNIELQQSQSDFFTILLHKPPYSEQKRTKAVQDYYSDLQTFLRIAHKNVKKVKNNPLPTIEDFQDCLSKN